jgi:diaminohydroxyphosphoribosylaminopyrimidine deaminase/5-amino-6-(5-phosphoribosylamino)uracil reductase
MVGAVILNASGEMIAEGWHEGPGKPHAEVVALDQLGGEAQGATMIVNLEPCCHHGRTAPCTDALLSSGLTRVVVGMVDPNPLMSGQGLQIVRDAGIEVMLGVEEAACLQLNASFVELMDRLKQS